MPNKPIQEKKCWWIFNHIYEFTANVGLDRKWRVITLYICKKCGKRKSAINYNF